MLSDQFEFIFVPRMTSPSTPNARVDAAND